MVFIVRQTQKTDKNDALAIFQATFLPDVTYIGGKNVEQQQLQSIRRLRELTVKRRDATQKQLISLLVELNIKIVNRRGGIISAIEDVLEDATNALTAQCRKAIYLTQEHPKDLFESLRHYDNCLESAATSHPESKKLMQLEGAGVTSAIDLYITLGCAEISVFNKGREASACIGLTPIQDSSGGKVALGSIGKFTKNSRLRSQLVCDATCDEKESKKRTWDTRIS